MKISSTAPGKLVLLGEYAVLHDHPAMVMAVDRRASVEILSRAGGFCVVEAAEVRASRVSFRFDAAGALVWESKDRGAIERLGLFSHVLQALADEIDYAALGPIAVTLSTSDFFTREDAPTKLGLGSSAALTVALASALVRAAGQEQLLERAVTWLGKLLSIHSSFQQGLGSGLDIAAALYGGVLEYQRTPGVPARARELEMPPGLELLCVWSGRSAATPEYLARLDAWRRGNERDFEHRISAMGSVVREGIDAVRDGDGTRFCAAVDAYGDALVGLSEASGLDILSKEHLQIRSIAASLGVVYKPCGAGGGDVGAAFSTDPARLACLKTRLAEMDFATPSLKLDTAGLRVALLQN